MELWAVYSESLENKIRKEKKEKKNNLSEEKDGEGDPSDHGGCDRDDVAVGRDRKIRVQAAQNHCGRAEEVRREMLYKENKPPVRRSLDAFFVWL